jgi:hypothetical protein
LVPAFTVKQIENLADDLAWIKVRLAAHEASEAEIRKQRTEYPPTPWLDKQPVPNPKPWKPPARQK